MKLYISIPVFLGMSEAAHSEPSNRLHYLEETLKGLHKLEGLAEFKPQILLHTCSGSESRQLEKYTNSHTFISQHGNNLQPIFLAAAAQRTMQTLINDEDYILHTEADQVFYVKDFNRLINQLHGGNYIAPHRLEQIVGGWVSEPSNKEVVEFHGAKYIIANRKENCDELKDQSREYYQCQTWYEGFAGAFLARGDAFKRVNFINSLHFPVESASGINIFDTHKCYKTVDYRDFFCEHLSAKESNAIHKNYKIL